MAFVRRNDKDKVPSAGWQCVVLKYANRTLQEQKDTFRQDGVSVDIARSHEGKGLPSNFRKFGRIECIICLSKRSTLYWEKQI